MKKILLLGETGTGKSLLAEKLKRDNIVIEKRVIFSKDELKEVDKVCLFHIDNKITLDVLEIDSFNLKNLRYVEFETSERIIELKGLKIQKVKLPKPDNSFISISKKDEKRLKEGA